MTGRFNPLAARGHAVCKWKASFCKAVFFGLLMSRVGTAEAYDSVAVGSQGYGCLHVDPQVAVSNSLGTDWSMHQGNAQHTGYCSECHLEPPLVMDWWKRISGGALYPVTVAGDYILASNRFVYNDTNRLLTCLSASDGDILWNVSFGLETSAITQPTASDSIVYIQIKYPLHVAAFDVRTGELIWYFPYRSQTQEYLAPTLYGDDLVFAGGFYGGVYCIDAITGLERWWSNAARLELWTPAVCDGMAYIQGGIVFRAFDIDSGGVSWELQFVDEKTSSEALAPYTHGASPVVDTAAGVAYCAYIVNLRAVDIFQKQLLWNVDGDFYIGRATVTPAICDGQVFAVESGDLVCYDGLTGDEGWRIDGLDSVLYPPAVASGHVFIGTESGTYAVSIEDQSVAWSTTIAGEISIAGDRLYIATADGYLFVLKSSQLTEVEDDESSGLPSQYALSQNYPNPFNPGTTIEFDLARRSDVCVEVINVLGERVRNLVETSLPAGVHTVEWDGKNDNGHSVATGVYFYRITAGDFTETKKMLLLK